VDRVNQESPVGDADGNAKYTLGDNIINEHNQSMRPDSNLNKYTPAYAGVTARGNEIFLKVIAPTQTA
jgi:hypothetical protein